MKRAGFTMIELIFVIVILGILASVAIPKLVGVKESADDGILRGFVGTLNRTVGPSIWSGSVMEGNGSVQSSDYNIDPADTEFPSAFTTQLLTMADCLDDNITGDTGAGVVGSTNDGKYHIICRDGSSSASPKFWYKQTANATDSVNIDGAGLEAK